MDTFCHLLDWNVDHNGDTHTEKGSLTLKISGQRIWLFQGQYKQLIHLVTSYFANLDSSVFIGYFFVMHYQSDGVVGRTLCERMLRQIQSSI